jgi:hypothetical protein
MDDAIFDQNSAQYARRASHPAASRNRVFQFSIVLIFVAFLFRQSVNEIFPLSQ